MALSRVISRRSFLRSGAWAVAGAVVAPTVARIFLSSAPNDFDTDRLVYRCYEHYGNDWNYSNTAAAVDLTEQSLEDMLKAIRVTVDTSADRLRIRPTKLIIHPSWIGTPELEAYRTGKLPLWV